jgi:hypothetical protein
MTHVVFEIKLEADKICALFVNQIDQLAIALRKNDWCEGGSY